MEALENNDLPWGGQTISVLFYAADVSSNLLLRSVAFPQGRKNPFMGPGSLVNAYDRAFPLHSVSQSCLSIRNGESQV